MLSLVLAAALGDVYVQPLASYGSGTWARLSGRVLDGVPPGPPDRLAGKLENVIENLAVLDSDEIVGAKVSLALFGKRFTATTDADGVFVIEARGTKPLSPGRQTLGVDLPDLGRSGQLELFVIDPEPGVAVVSDVDDTIVRTYVTSAWKMLKQVLTKNAAQLEAAPGMPATYRAWSDAGVKGFFYVSSSPQNFYPRLRGFIGLAEYPAGPIFLKNLGQDDTLDNKSYKLLRIMGLFDAYPRLKFVLVGDSGEQDPSIYREVKQRYPDRVVAIVIRDLVARPVAPATDLVLIPENGANPEALVKVLP